MESIEEFDTQIVRDVGQIESMAVNITGIEKEIRIGDFVIHYLPPGPVEANLVTPSYFFDININAGKHLFAQNSDKPSEVMFPANSFAFYQRDTQFFLKTENTAPGCVLQVGDKTVNGWFEAAEIERNKELEVGYTPDDIAADIGLSTMRIMSEITSGKQRIDHLTLEALALAVGARGMALLSSKDDDIDTEMGKWSRRGNKLRLQRAIDFANSNLSNSLLSVADMAEAAGLSSCHFSSIFKAQTGESAYAYILRKRTELAKALITATRKPLSHVAFEAGFSNQAHLSTVIKKKYGTTPGKMRSG